MHDEGHEYQFRGELQIAPSDVPLATPSVLGRDLFDNFRITYHRAEGLLTLE